MLYDIRNLGFLWGGKYMRNPKWHRDELILALDLFFRHNPLRISKSHEEVVKLSNILNSLPIYSNKPDKKRFRNPNGVYMKLCNFLRFDPEYQGVGLERGGRLEKEVWDDFSSDPIYLRNVAQGITSGLDLLTVEFDDTVDEENEFPEGKVLYRLHKYRERNRSLVAKAKELAIRKGSLECEVCGFDFFKTYGELGKGYIECHHVVPVSEYSINAKTKVTDLALVCSNCHRMLHRRRPWLGTAELKQVLKTGANIV